MAARRSAAAAWASFSLGLAAAYNLAWGALVVLAPDRFLELLDLQAASRPLAQCVGMLVGVYGLGYWIAAWDPARYWPLVLVGLAGKLLGPVGAVWAIGIGELPAVVLLVNLFNDVVWWLPFAWILWAVRRGELGSSPPDAGRDPSLYRRLLGPRFDALAPQLQRFHGATAPIELEGRFSVRRGRGFLRNWIADREGFPRETGAVDVHLRVEPRGLRERWRRSFGTQVLESWQWARGDLLAEGMGAVTLFVQPRVSDGRLEIESVRSTLFGFPLAPILAPYVLASARDVDGGIEVEVHLELAPLGTLVEYAGTVRVVESPAGLSR